VRGRLATTDSRRPYICGSAASPPGALEQIRRVLVLGDYGLVGAAGEPVDDVPRVAEQGHLDECRADVLAELLQLQDELEPVEELRNHHVMTGGQVLAGHRQRQPTGQVPRHRQLVSPAAAAARARRRCPAPTPTGRSGSSGNGNEPTDPLRPSGVRVIAVGVAVLLVSGCAAETLPGCAGDPSTSSAGKTSASPSAAGRGMHVITCGMVLPPPLTRTGPRGAQLAVTKVARSSATGTAEVTVALTARSAAQFSAPGSTPLQVLLVRDGHVVDRLGTYAFNRGKPVIDRLAEGPAGQGGTGAIGHILAVRPHAPWTTRVTGPGHCSGADWAAVWHGAPGYSLVAVMSVPDLPEKPGTAAVGDPLLTSTPQPA